MEELISKKKLLADLNGIREVLSGQGDPILASVLTRAIQCVEKQPVVKIDGDLVEVVRCKDCVRQGKCTITEHLLICSNVPDCGYCHDGIRKEWKSDG